MSESSSALLQIEDLQVLFGQAPHRVRAVDGVSLAIQAGQTVALVGESGCGKSTLARAVMGLVRPSVGRIRFKGTALPELAERAPGLCRQLQMIFQDPDASLNPRLTLQASVGEPLELHERLSRQERERRVVELFEHVGLDPSLRQRYPHELSGGQRQRVCIARALATEPELILCDEAVSALDVSIQAQILNLLADLKARFGLAYLFITHDLGVVRYVADRIAVMYLGQLVEWATTEELFVAPQHPYTRALLAAVPSIERAGSPPAVQAAGEIPSPARPPPGCRFHTRCTQVFDRCRTEAPELYAVGTGQSRCFLSEASQERA